MTSTYKTVKRIHDKRVLRGMSNHNCIVWPLAIGSNVALHKTFCYAEEHKNYQYKTILIGNKIAKVFYYHANPYGLIYVDGCFNQFVFSLEETQSN